jgi:hypothetical protein
VTTSEEQAVPVAQEDREAAANVVASYRDQKNGNWQQRIRDGLCDDGEMVQAFARHRLAFLLCKSGEGAGEIERMKDRIAVLERENLNYAKTMDIIGQLPADLRTDATQTREAEALAGIERIMREGIHENDGPNRIWLNGVPHEGPVADWAIRTFRKVGDIARAAINARGGA